MASVKKRLEKLRELMRRQRINSLLLTDFVNVGYITGFTGGDSFALITPKSRYIITDSRYTEQAGKQAPHFEIITRKGEMSQAVREIVRKHRLKGLSFESTGLSYELFRTYKKALPGVRLKPEKPLVQKLRCIKEPREVRMIQKAVDIAQKAMRRVRKLIRPGIRENELAAEVEYQMRLLGGDREAFDTIVASGRNSSMPHAQCTDRRLRFGETITIDWGARCGFYNSDLTRVFFIGRIRPLFKKIYEIVLGAQRAAIKTIRPGVSAQEIDKAARDYIHKKGYGKWFTHALGHGLGLEVHEAPRIGQKVNTALKPGMVFTVEPGIYLPGRGGVRIEDDVLVTAGGCKVLSSFTRNLRQAVV